MAMGKNLVLGVMKRTSSFGRKRILILNHMEFDSVDVVTPKKKQAFEGKCDMFCEKYVLEDLPQEILIKILCGVDHDDLKRLFHVSKLIREAVVIAKKWHFEYSTPKKIPAFRCSLNLDEFPPGDFEDKEAPNAPKQSRTFRSRLTIKNPTVIRSSLSALSPLDKNH